MTHPPARSPGRRGNHVSPTTTLLLVLVLLAAQIQSGESIGWEYPRDALRWVHTMKCGQTFAATMYAYACPPDLADRLIEYITTSNSPHKLRLAAKTVGTEPCHRRGDHKWGQAIPDLFGHEPLRPAEVGHVALMLRRPDQRTIAHVKYFVNLLRQPAEKVELQLRDRGDKFYYHCQVRMLAGERCPGPSRDVSQESVQRAVDIVSSNATARFVGILELWATSIALFHCLFMGGTAPRAEELLNLHYHQYGDEAPEPHTNKAPATTYTEQPRSNYTEQPPMVAPQPWAATMESNHTGRKEGRKLQGGKRKKKKNSNSIKHTRVVSYGPSKSSRAPDVHSSPFYHSDGEDELLYRAGLRRFKEDVIANMECVSALHAPAAKEVEQDVDRMIVESAARASSGGRVKTSEENLGG